MYAYSANVTTSFPDYKIAIALFIDNLCHGLCEENVKAISFLTYQDHVDLCRQGLYALYLYCICSCQNTL